MSSAEATQKGASLAADQNGGVEFKFTPGERVGGGRFRLERLIGRGGMGTVWLALDERLKERVALKFISERIRGNRAALESMRQETSRSHSLSHQHIVRIHDLHEIEGEPAFISMEFVDGQNLHELARNQTAKAFPMEEVWRWAQPLCGALAYAHSRGVIHRDLKPANLMLDKTGELKMADFGLSAALRDPADTQDRTVSGTPAYMSPQQLSGAPAMVTDDIYSLGACLFELLTGRPVFEGSDIRRSIEFEPAPWLSAIMKSRGLEANIPEEFEDLLLQCLSKIPANRPQSAREFLDKAAAALGEVQPPQTAPAVRKSISVRKILLASSLALAAILAAVSFRGARQPGTPFLDLSQAPVRASSFAAPSDPKHAFDRLHRMYERREETRWAVATKPGNESEWIAVDLGRDMQIEKIVIDWELAFAKDFAIRTRTSTEGFVDDPAQWTKQAAVVGFQERIHAAVNLIDHEQDVVFDFANGNARLGEWMAAREKTIERRPVIARHVMVHLTKLGPNNSLVYSIYEIEIAAKPVY